MAVDGIVHRIDAVIGKIFFEWKSCSRKPSIHAGLKAVRILFPEGWIQYVTHGFSHDHLVKRRKCRKFVVPEARNCATGRFRGQPERRGENLGGARQAEELMFFDN
ncbi:MAG: hypothetical protein J0I17_11760, partial ['Candidatus Kapabacteria' thiocyanatum]|nr:hypothetical protein ['Candidatus Kapabacteria' thiocyanatum]